MLQRCSWAEASVADRRYHDREWGVPLHDDRGLFELLILEGAQAGLSWSTIINKRAGYRQLYQDFDPRLVAGFDQQMIEALLANPAIVRNRLKVEASVKNARAFLQLQQRHGSFDHFIWQFVDGQPRQNRWRSMAEVPASVATSERMSKALKQAGFSFVGPTICYAFMQASGMVNDHIVDCFRHAEVARLGGG